jgi:hypothetical protein
LQNEGGEQAPLEQSAEQHCEPCVQAFPSVLQLVLSGVQVPLQLQIPLQHCALPMQARPSETHTGNEQTLPWHVPLQQSVACAHAPPSLRQLAPASGLNGPPFVAAPSPPPPESPPAPESPATAPASAPASRPAPSVDVASEGLPASALVAVELLLPHPTIKRLAARSAALANNDTCTLLMKW